MTTHHVRLFTAVCLLSCLFAAPLAGEGQSRATRGSKPAPAMPAATITLPPAPSPDTPQRAKVVSYNQKDVVPIRSKVRFTTLIVLPPSEVILDAACGDKEFWTINAIQNIAYIKPARTGAQTNMNLVAASGNIYSFVLQEVSDLPLVDPDLTVYVGPNDESMLAAVGAAPRFASAREVEDYRQQAIKAKEDTRQVQAASQAAIAAGVNRFITNVRFAYTFTANKRPFFVRVIYHDFENTFIQARPEETPTLWEIRDGKPNLIDFDFKDGVMVVPGKVLDKGYLAIGKERLVFERQD